MYNWRNFTPSDIEYDWESDKLAEHGLNYEEAVQAFLNPFDVFKNKGYEDRYQLFGRTNGGRKVEIIFQLKPQKVVRIITGWAL
jgi:uncharacterized DUF497 family protein